MQVLTEVVPEPERVYRWRLEWLLAVGYTNINAEKLANDLDIDLHFACDLRRKCKDEKLCMRIHYGK